MSGDNLRSLGFGDWLADHIPAVENNFEYARVIAVNKDRYTISTGEHEMPAELTGRFIYQADDGLDYPTVGDFVGIQSFDEHSLGIVHEILPRKSLLKRKDPGKNLLFQLIAANLDYAFIMQAADTNFNLNRLERYLVMVNDSDIQPIIVLNKVDLIPEGQLLDIQEMIQRLHGDYSFQMISNITGSGVAELQASLEPRKTYCLLGSSGVGKTTLLNTLLGEEQLAVGDVREGDHKGRHTTVTRQMVRLENGSLFIDTPGMRELGNFDIESGLSETFSDILSQAEACRFRDCSHEHEQGCAVIIAVKQGVIDEERYLNYMKLRKESTFYQMTYLEKRQRDKSFGKMIKNVKKEMRKK